MSRRGFVVVDLGFGDAGKGAVTDALVRQHNARWVVRYSGGSQCSHNVVLPDGRRHVFAQFGSGTLAGAQTFLSRHVIIHPEALSCEADALRANFQLGSMVREKVKIDPRALVSTPYLRYLNKAKECARGKDRHGSCGHGIGETRSYWLRHGEESIMAGDLSLRSQMNTLIDKLVLQRERVKLKLAELDQPPPDNSAYVCAFHCHPREIADRLRAGVYGCQFGDEFFIDKDDTVVFEGAQGILLDEYCGFHPHTTWSTVTSQNAFELAVGWSDHMEMTTLGVMRAYMTRHGAGPLPTWDEALSNRLLDPGNPYNDWQGDMRFGQLDLGLLSYALACDPAVDGLVVTHLDQLDEDLRKMYATRLTTEAFSHAPSLVRQANLAGVVRASPTWARPTVCANEAEFLRAIEDHLNRPVAGTGRGPSHIHYRIQSRQPFAWHNFSAAPAGV